MEKLLILGAGGHGKIVLDCAISIKIFDCISFLDDNKVGEEVLGYPVIGELSKYKDYVGKYSYAIVALGNNGMRSQLTQALLEAGYKVPILIHPKATVSYYSQIGEGTVILAGAIINVNVEIGRSVIVNTGAIVEHDCHIAEGVHLSPGCKMGGGTSIGERSWICIGASIIDHIQIGRDCVIGAGAVVIKSIPNNTRCYGVPAKKKKSKTILILANHDLGLYKFRKELIVALINQGYTVYISLPEGENIPALVEMGCRFIPTPIERRGLNPFKDIKLIHQYKEMIRTIKPNQVITYTIKPNIYGGLACRWYHIPYYANITGLGSAFQKEGLLKKLVVWLYRKALREVRYTFFENETNKEAFIKSRIIKEKKAVLMPGAGVNLEEYPLVELPNEEKGIRFLFIGRVMKEKGINELFDVARRVKEEYPNVSFDIVGPFEEDYEKVISDLVAEKIIEYYGYQKDVKPFIAKAHCFILPSYHEGMANTLLEAAAMGRPLITSNIEGCKEAIKGNGYLVQVADREDLYQKIKAFLELPTEDRKLMSIYSRKHMEEVFDKKKVVHRTLEYLNKV